MKCRRTHTAETYFVGRLELETEAGHVRRVDSRAAQEQARPTCTARLPKHLGRTPRELRLSMARSVWFTPTPPRAEAGADWFRCDVVVVAGPSRLLTLPTSTKGFGGAPAVAMCATAAPGTKAFRRVGCGAKHAWRAVSTVDIPGGKLPSKQAVADRMEGPCGDAARAEPPTRWTSPGRRRARRRRSGTRASATGSAGSRHDLPMSPLDARTDVRRCPEKQVRDVAALHAILDEAPRRAVGFQVDGQPYVIRWPAPATATTLLLHGSTGSRLMRALAAGAPVCVSVTHLDGLVYARSAFESSMRYRSATVLGTATEVPRPTEAAALQVLTEHLLPGRWAELRAPRAKELAATSVLRVPLDEWSVKVGRLPRGPRRGPRRAGVGGRRPDAGGVRRPGGRPRPRSRPSRAAARAVAAPPGLTRTRLRRGGTLRTYRTVVSSLARSSA